MLLFGWQQADAREDGFPFRFEVQLRFVHVRASFPSSRQALEDDKGFKVLFVADPLFRRWWVS